MLHEHHHVPPNPMQRNPRIGMQQMGPPPNQRTQPMLMSIQASAVPVPHSGVLVPMPTGPALVNTTTIPQQQQQPKSNIQVYHYEPVMSVESSDQSLEQHQQNMSNTSTSSGPNNLANTKEKTPMCLVNELARYNKIQHQYRLTGEQGPAHKRIFTVTLKLGNEEYEAEGASIKKAQHSAAAQALAKTEFKHPPPKTIRNNRPGLRSSSFGVVTPTAELNVLATKRKERTVYVVENGAPQHAQGYINQGGFYPRHNIYSPHGQPRYGYDARRSHNIRGGHYPHYDNRYYGSYKPGYQHNPGEQITVRLRVGKREYSGIGFSVQAARHDAAAKAIEDIKQMGTDSIECSLDETEEDVAASNDLNSDLKSPISLVHEIALKRNLSVTFEVLSEKGPPHMKVFITQCRVGDITTEGEGNGKKISKKRAAEKMLEELSKLPALPNMANIAHMKRKRVATKKKTRNLIKVNVEKTTDYVEDINPISRLIQIQQANKKKEPVYTVLEERGAPRKREFVIEASVNGHSCTGVGPNKKIAKRNAAEALLGLMGYSNPVPTTPKPALKAEKEQENAEKPRKVTFVEEKTEAVPVGGSGGRQLVPGLLLVGDQSGAFQQNKAKLAPEVVTAATNAAAEVKKPGQIPVTKIPPQPIQGIRSMDQLMYLAQLMNIEVHFSDFPKANHEMFLTLVSLSTHPPQVCHGEGPTIEASHEKAALEALKVLSELGLDIAPNKDNAGENIHNNGVKPAVGPKSTLTPNGISK